MTVPAQRTADDYGDGWADRLRHVEAERDAAQRDAVALQARVDDLRITIVAAHDYLVGDTPLPPSRAHDAALRTLREALNR